MTKEETMEVAARIARDLFTNGGGQHASRLVLEGPNGQDIGGWGEDAVKTRIAQILRLIDTPHASGQTS